MVKLLDLPADILLKILLELPFKGYWDMLIFHNESHELTIDEQVKVLINYHIKGKDIMM